MQMMQPCWCWLYYLPQALRTDSSSDGDDTPSPKSHTTQLINLTEMQQLSAQEQLCDELSQQQQTEQLRQQLTQHSLGSSILQQQQQQLQPMQQLPPQMSDGQLPLAAGIGTRLLGSSDYSGDQEIQLGSGEYAGAGDLQLLTDEDAHGNEDRDLCVNCQQAEENKLSFQLRFTEPEGGSAGHCTL